MSILKVPGAELYYHAVGNGPLLVMIPGAKGDGLPFQGLVPQLKDQYRVVTYDRRGFSRSRLESSLDNEHSDPDDLSRLSIDASDVRHIIEHLGEEPAIVFGNSSGAIVALQVLMDHADIIRAVIAHEPPLVQLLDNSEEWLRFFLQVYDTYKKSGVPAAMQAFSDGAFGGTDTIMMKKAISTNRENPYVLSNARYWMEHELRQYPRVKLQFDVLIKHAEKLILACGHDSKGTVAHTSSKVLSDKLRIKITEFPGGHLGFIQHPVEFSTRLLAALMDRK